MADKRKSSDAKKNSTDREEPVSSPRKSQADRYIWGVIFIAIGGLLLMDNLGYIEVNLVALWQLWPLLIILFGLSVMALKGWLSVVVSIVGTVLVVGLVVATVTGVVSPAEASKSEEVSINRESDQVKNLELAIKTGGGNLVVDSYEGEQLVEATFESSNLWLENTVSVDGDTQKVNLETKGNAFWFSGGAQNNLTVQLAKGTPTDLAVDAGAVDVRADLSQVATRSVLVNSGASQVWLKLGNFQQSSQVDIDTGVSSVDILVPKDAGVKLKIDAGLSSHNLPEGFVKIDEETYQSANYDKSEQKINIAVDMGVSSFKLSTY